MHTELLAYEIWTEASYPCPSVCVAEGPSCCMGVAHMLLLLLQHLGITTVEQNHAILARLLPPHQSTACLCGVCMCVKGEGGGSALICVSFCLTDCDTEQWLHSVLQSLSAGDNE